MQFSMIYLKTWGGAQPYVAFSTLEFQSCFFVLGGTRTARNSLSMHKPVSDNSWLVGGACLPCLEIETLSGEGSLLV